MKKMLINMKNKNLFVKIIQKLKIKLLSKNQAINTIIMLLLILIRHHGNDHGVPSMEFSKRHCSPSPPIKKTFDFFQKNRFLQKFFSEIEYKISDSSVKIFNTNFVEKCFFLFAKFDEFSQYVVSEYKLYFPYSKRCHVSYTTYS